MSCYDYNRGAGATREEFESKRLPDIELKNANGQVGKKIKMIFFSHLVLLDSDMCFLFFVFCLVT
jgi:hypothetical protein